MSLAIPMARGGMRGDPFLHQSVVGRVAGGAAKGFLGGGGIIGAVTGAVGGLAGKKQPPAMPGTGLAPGSPFPPNGGTGLFPFPGTGLAPQQPVMQVPSLNGTGVTIACPSGYRPNKTGYFVKAGRPGSPFAGAPTYIHPGTKCVKIRRRNPLNPRAMDRAIGRLSSAKRAARKLGRISIRSTCPPNGRR